MYNGIRLENLPEEIDVAKMCSNFKKFGRILSASIDVDEHLKSSGKGYISFDNPSSAQSAAKSMNDCKAYGNTIKVVIGENKCNGKTSSKLYTKIFIKNIKLQWDECDLSQEFDKFGDIREASISKTDGTSNGYGFIEFEKHSSAKDAVESKHKCLIVRPYLPKQLRNATPDYASSARELLEKSIQFNNLHVKNIPKDMDEAELKKLFERFGEIQSVFVARDDARKSKGFGFVCFEFNEDAANAKKNMNGYLLNEKHLEVNFNQKKEARQHYLLLKNFAGSNEKSFQKAKNVSENTLVPEKKKLEKREALLSLSSKNRYPSAGRTMQRLHVSTMDLGKRNAHWAFTRPRTPPL